MIQKARTIIPRTNYYEGRPLGVEPTQTSVLLLTRQMGFNPCGFLRVSRSVNSILGNTGVSRVKWGYWSRGYTKYEGCFTPFWELFAAKIAIVYCLLPIMRPASWLWDHFYKGDRANSTQHKGFCNYHAEHHLSTLLKREEDTAAADATYTQRSKTVLLPEGP
jgi:hypothetical protein